MKSQPGNKAPTMADVAKKAGVSTMTVSRALKPDSYIKQDTREKILKAVDELGYVMDTTAAGLSSRKTGFVAMIIPSINNANFAQTVRGVTETLESSRLQLLLAHTNYSVDEEEKLVAQLLARRPEAMILTGQRHTERCRRLLENADIPVIETWDEPLHPIGFSVGFSHAQAASLSLEHLQQQGCKKIAFLGGDNESDSRGFARRHGYIKAMQEQGQTPILIDLGEPPVTMENGAQAYQKFAADFPDCDGVICVSDLLAFGFLSAAKRAGKTIPDDFMIAGFGDYDLAAITIPSITTIAVQPKTIGKIAAQKAIELMEGEGTSNKEHLSVRIELVARETTGNS